MNQLFSRPLTCIILLVFIILGGWISFLPVRIAQNLKSTLQEQTGRAVTVGGSSYSLSPQFGIALQNVEIGGAATLNEIVFRADTILVPVSAWQLLIGHATTQTLIADGADIHVNFDGIGHSNVFAGQSPKSLAAFQLQLTNSSFRFFDERTGDQIELEEISGRTNFSSEGEISSTGSAVVNGQFINFDASLASLERAFSDGSPLDLTVDGVASSFSFSGRIATIKRLNLAGQAEMTSTDVPRLAKWLGVNGVSLADVKTMSLGGALDSDGPVMLLKNANLKLGQMTAKGDVSFSNAGERPTVTAALGFDHLDLNLIRPVVEARWSDKPIDYSGLGGADVQFRLSANAIDYGSLKTGAATVEGTLQNRVLSAAIKSQDIAGGTAQIDLGLDATQLPPKLKLDVALANVAAKPALAALIDQNFMTGALTLESHLAATGNSQAELMSTLSGDASVFVDGGTISGADFNTFAAQPMDGWNGGQTASLEGQIQFTINEGVAKLGDNQLDAIGVSLQSEGEIDLLRKSIAVTTGPDVKVKIQGPWGKPTLTPQ